MTQPLALILYEKLLPGSQLVNRLQDLKYRVQTLAEPGQLVTCAETAKPMLVLADLDSSRDNVLSVLGQLRANATTKHIPVIAFSGQPPEQLQAAVQAAGITLFVSEAAILNHLPVLLEQALQVE